MRGPVRGQYPRPRRLPPWKTRRPSAVGAPGKSWPACLRNDHSVTASSARRSGIASASRMGDEIANGAADAVDPSAAPGVEPQAAEAPPSRERVLDAAAKV